MKKSELEDMVTELRNLLNKNNYIRAKKTAELFYQKIKENNKPKETIKEPLINTDIIKAE